MAYSEVFEGRRSEGMVVSFEYGIRRFVLEAQTKFISRSVKEAVKESTEGLSIYLGGVE